MSVPVVTYAFKLYKYNIMYSFQLCLLRIVHDWKNLSCIKFLLRVQVFDLEIYLQSLLNTVVQGRAILNG